MIDAKVVNKAIRKKLETMRTIVPKTTCLRIMKPASHLSGIACLRTRPIQREQSIDVSLRHLFIGSQIQ